MEKKTKINTWASIEEAFETEKTEKDKSQVSKSHKCEKPTREVEYNTRKVSTCIHEDLISMYRFSLAKIQNSCHCDICW